MLTFADELILEMDNFSGDLIEPDGDLEPGDHVAGVISVRSQRLYTIAQRWNKAACETTVNVRFGKKEDRGTNMIQAMSLAQRCDAAMDVFWISIRVEYPELWGKPSVGIRVGWKAVWSQSDEKDVIKSLFSSLGQR